MAMFNALVRVDDTVYINPYDVSAIHEDDDDANDSLIRFKNTDTVVRVVGTTPEQVHALISKGIANINRNSYRDWRTED